MTTETIHRLPEGEPPFGVGPILVVRIPEDLLTSHGNLVASAGLYEAKQSEVDAEGVIIIRAYDHYATTDGGMWVVVDIHRWCFPDEKPRSVPPHSCFDHAYSGVAGGIYCGLCMADLS